MTVYDILYTLIVDTIIELAYTGFGQIRGKNLQVIVQCLLEELDTYLFDVQQLQPKHKIFPQNVEAFQTVILTMFFIIIVMVLGTHRTRYGPHIQFQSNPTIYDKLE